MCGRRGAPMSYLDQRHKGQVELKAHWIGVGGKLSANGIHGGGGNGVVFAISITNSNHWSGYCILHFGCNIVYCLFRKFISFLQSRQLTKKSHKT